MGLDMYLYKHIYIGANYEHNKITGSIDLYKDGEPIKVDLKKVSFIKETFAYWRKANAIHGWIVDNVQNYEDDCKEYFFDKEKMEELLEIINNVLEDNKEAPLMLPTEEGFFFGHTLYNEKYFEDLRYTKGVLEEALTDEENDFYYQSSW